MRHAKSSWKDPSIHDYERPLNRRGKRDAPRMGNLLMEYDLIPEIILCSSAQRARLTVNFFLETCDFEGEVQYLDDLYHADYMTYLELLAELSDKINLAMIVGHNPEINQFLELVCDSYDHMPTAAIAHIQLSCETWAGLTAIKEGEILHLWKPREIDD